MQWKDNSRVSIEISGVKLEAHCWGPPPLEAPTLVLLHEGLGCVTLWRDFPQMLTQATGYGIFAYSRQGYGQSEPALLPRPLDYMTREAMDVLPLVLEEIQIKRSLLIGHSDGASICAIYAGNHKNNNVKGICLIAPHFFTEPDGLASIEKARKAYEDTDLRDKLDKYHSDPNNAFIGWNAAWLDPNFKAWNIASCIDAIEVPVLAIQGADDQYGTRRQIDIINDRLPAQPKLVLLDNCKHSPHIEQTEATVNIISEFASKCF